MKALKSSKISELIEWLFLSYQLELHQINAALA
jgi:hypothetical protein